MYAGSGALDYAQRERERERRAYVYVRIRMCVRMRLCMRVCVCVCKAQCACDYRICACLRARGARCVGLRSGKLLSERRLARVRRDKLPTGTGSFKPVFKVRVRVCVECLFLRHRGTALYRANHGGNKPMTVSGQRGILGGGLPGGVSG